MNKAQAEKMTCPFKETNCITGRCPLWRAWGDNLDKGVCEFVDSMRRLSWQLKLQDDKQRGE